LGLALLEKFSGLSWESRFVSSFPGDQERDNFVRRVREVLYSEVQPTPVRNPMLLGWSEKLAVDFGVAKPTEKSDFASIELLSGNRVLDKMRPYAARYGGHQFGNWAGQLGDGRAITLGEVVTPKGRMEFQLKGAGPTPYSRRADGRAVLRSSVREFLCSEAMHFLGVPTTRALSLVATGDVVIRDMFYDGHPEAEPGAIVCRVAPSFLRFGNFEILTANKETDLLKMLTDFLITDHYPELELSDADVYGKLFDAVSRRTALMIAHWMRVGFVHGVMNTDNMSALGLTIDYGPYGWLEPYDPDWTPNTTDAETRRYRFGNQPNIALWNLARFAEALFPLIKKEERIHESLAIYQESFGEHYGRMLCQKFGVQSLEAAEDQTLVQEVFALQQYIETDYTVFFRKLSDWNANGDGKTFIELISPAFYTPDALNSQLREKWIDWSKKYSEKLKKEGLSDQARSLSMKKANPKYVLRNYLAQNAINAAGNGDLSVLERLMRVLQSPYDEMPGEEDLAAKRPEWARSAPGCSALSCSS